jgi:hypothetical protein
MKTYVGWLFAYRSARAGKMPTRQQVWDAATDIAVASSASANKPMPKCLCLTCSRLQSNGGSCQPNTNSFVTACGGYSGTSA